MISRIKNNFSELMESLATKKDEIFKQNKIINLESLLSFYKENKKIFLEKKEVLLSTINEYNHFFPILVLCLGHLTLKYLLLNNMLHQNF